MSRLKIVQEEISMCGASSQTALPLLNESAGCSCCSPKQELAAESTHRTNAGQQETQFRVAGMTCGHCVSSVSAELARVEGVSAVQIDLVPNGLSTVTVYSETELGVQALRQAVTEAGYELAGTV
jgi:copper chaperone CopZ